MVQAILPLQMKKHAVTVFLPPAANKNLTLKPQRVACGRNLSIASIPFDFKVSLPTESK